MSKFLEIMYLSIIVCVCEGGAYWAHALSLIEFVYFFFPLEKDIYCICVCAN